MLESNKLLYITYCFEIDGYIIHVKSNKNLNTLVLLNELRDYNISTMLDKNTIWYIEDIKLITFKYDEYNGIKLLTLALYEMNEDILL